MYNTFLLNGRHTLNFIMLYFDIQSYNQYTMISTLLTLFYIEPHMTHIETLCPLESEDYANKQFFHHCRIKNNFLSLSTI